MVTVVLDKQQRANIKKIAEAILKRRGQTLEDYVDEKLIELVLSEKLQPVGGNYDKQS